MKGILFLEQTGAWLSGLILKETEQYELLKELHFVKSICDK